MKRKPSAPVEWIREDRPVTLAELAWLESPAGREACAAMAGGEPADTPAAIEHWRRRLEPDQVSVSWHQAQLRRQAGAKFSRADEMLFDRVGLEQATDEVVAAHKARRFAGMSKVADLCCGIGGDTIALAGWGETPSPNPEDRPAGSRSHTGGSRSDAAGNRSHTGEPFPHGPETCATRAGSPCHTSSGTGYGVIAVDWSEPRLMMARHNAGVYGRGIDTLVADVIFDRPDADAVHIDPDRRPAGPRRHQPDASSPGLDVLERIVRHYEHAAIKLSPGADFDALPFDAEIEVISHHGECKQAVAWTGRFRQAYRRATVLPSGEALSAEAGDGGLIWPEPRPPRPGEFLFEPDAAVIRAGLVGVVARQHGLAPIDRRLAYLTSDHAPETALLTPFRIIDVTDFSLKRARTWLAGHDVARVDIKTRGFAARPEEILRRLRLTGRRPAVLFLTRIAGRPVAILADRHRR